MARKKKHEDHVNHERWLVSYADFITLLFAFFVTMYASSREDGTKMGYVLDSIHRAFGVIQLSEKGGGGNSVMENAKGGDTPSIITDMGTYEQKTMEETAKEIKQELEKGQSGTGAKKTVSGTGAEKAVSVTANERGLVISIADKVFFDPGQAAIRDEVNPVLDKVAQALLKVPNHIRIEGHTDNIPINTPQFPSNWELSSGRATSIIRHFLSKYPFDPKKLSAAGYGEYRPIASNSTQEGRLRNRRVDIVIMNSKLGEKEEPK
ncbi:MAG: flagellar motor protein MotB [Pseudomonadota bacterium]